MNKYFTLHAVKIIHAGFYAPLKFIFTGSAIYYHVIAHI